MKHYFLNKRTALLLVSAVCLSFSVPEASGVYCKSGDNLFYGEFKIRKVRYYVDTLSKLINYVASANLYGSAVSSSQSWRSDMLGMVYYNDVPLKYNDLVRTYLDTLQRPSNSGFSWRVESLPDIGSFNVSLAELFPCFEKMALLPGLLSRSQDFSMDLSGCTNADEIEVTMYDGTIKTSAPYYRRVPATIGSITIPAADLASLNGRSVTVTLSFIKNEYMNVNGKLFKFEKRFDVVKPMPMQD